MFFRFPNFSNNFFEFFGPIPEKLSRMNCFCSFFVRFFLVAFREFSFCFFFERTCMNFAVSKEFFVKITGILFFRVIERRNPLMAFAFIPFSW